MRPSELLDKAISGDASAARELGRLLDSLMRLAGPGVRAGRSELGLVLLANNGESEPDMVMRSDDSRIAGRIVAGV